MMTEALAAYLHYLSIVVTAAILAAELFLYRRDLTLAHARLLQRLDIAYPLAALALLATGLARLFWFGKGPAFYTANPVFWIKMGLFAAVALVSVVPTMHFLRWRGEVRAGKAPVIAERAFRHVRGHLLLEAALFLAIPLLAVLMARGIGR
jgi:putative membrane protein